MGCDWGPAGTEMTIDSGIFQEGTGSSVDEGLLCSQFFDLSFGELSCYCMRLGLG